MNKELKQTTLKIMLADDDRDDCYLFENALKELPLTASVTFVRDGEEVMNYLDENIDHLPDVLFLDLSMPRKTGYECLTEIKENKKMAVLPVVILTTSFIRNKEIESNLAKNLLKMGARGYIRKPSDFIQFKQIIYTTLCNIFKNNNAQNNVHLDVTIT